MDRFQKIEIGLVIIILLFNVGFFIYVFGGSISGFVLFGQTELVAPNNFVKEGNIKVVEEGVIINVEDVVLSRYVDSNSMLPVLGKYSTGIGIKPESEGYIGVGDIISFWQDNNIIVHRVVEKGIDKYGVYFITKGDNNDLKDERIRFSDIDSVLVGVIY